MQPAEYATIAQVVAAGGIYFVGLRAGGRVRHLRSRRDDTGRGRNR